VVLGLPIGYGAPVGDVVVYAGFELCFVVLPGWAAYRAMVTRPGDALRQLAIGWALGYVLLILSFIATAATDTRPLLYAYPVVVLALAAVVIHRRSGPTASRIALPSRSIMWALAAVCIVALVYIGFSYFPGSPLPGSRNTTYFIDYPRWISLAAEAKHHWPITDPSDAGEPLPYHYFVNVYLAAASQVTGIELPVIYLRLFILPLVTLATLLFAVAGRALTGSYAVGLLAALLAFLVGEVRLDPSATFADHTPFFGLFFTLLFRSPSFLLGLVLFLPLIVLIGEALRRRDRLRSGQWLLVGFLMVGASDAKVSILPLLLAALLAYLLVVYMRSRDIDRSAVIAAGMAFAVLALLWLVQYRGYSSGLRLDPLADVNLMPAVQLIKGDLATHITDFPGRDAALDVGAVVLGVLGLLAAPLVGLVWLVRSWGRELPAAQIWLLSILLVGVFMALTFAEPGTQSGLYFLFYGIVAGYLLSAHGIVLAWERRPRMEGRWLRFAVFMAAFACVVTAIVVVPEAADPFQGPRERAITYLVRYGALILGLALLYLIGRRWMGPTRWPAAAMVTAALVLVGAFATPFDNLRAAVENAPGGASLGKPMSPGLYRGLTWIRDNTPTDSVLAVNNQWIDAADTVPLEFNYSAFGERRVFLEGWGYSQRTRELGYAMVVAGANPFAGRLAVNESAFADADPRALLIMAREFGVDYLVADRDNGIPTDVAGLKQRGEVVYGDPDVLVLRVSMDTINPRGPGP
jgi:hypothetical protein